MSWTRSARSLLPQGAFRVLVAVIVLLGAACDSQPSPVWPRYGVTPPKSKIEYSFSVHPLHNPTRLAQVFDPLIELLNRHIAGVHFHLEASIDYASYDEKLFQGQHDFSVPNPYQTLRSLEHGYRVIGKVRGDDAFRGIILVRRDSGIREIAELKGRAVSFPAPTALAATMMPQLYLKQHGVDPLRDIEPRYVGSQESSIMNVYHGHTAAGATWPSPWEAFRRERPEEAKELEVRWVTESLPNIAVVVNRRVPSEHAEAVRKILLHLHESEEGEAILRRMGFKGFEGATAETYRPVADFIQAYSREIHDPGKVP